MSRYLNSEQQEQFDLFINDFASQFDSSESGITVKVGTTRGYRADVENKPKIDKFKPFELEKLDSSVKITESNASAISLVPC